MKTFVFGIDGASYDLMEKFMAEAKLPAFEKLKEKGIYGKLNSTVPPHTAPGWMSAFSGVNPGMHGIYQFWDTQAKNYVGKFMGSVDMGVPAVWDILNQYGKKTGVVNVPMTHPPKKLDGFMITWPLSNTLRYTYPEDLLIKIAQSGGHYVNDLTIMCDGKPDYINMAIEVTKKRVKTLEFLLNNYEWDFMSVVFTEIDRVSHFFWHYMDAESPEYQKQIEDRLRTAVEDIYTETDRALGKILELLPSNTALLVLSDHGFGVGYTDFYVQTYLMDKGYLKSCKINQQADNRFQEVNKNSWFEYKVGTDLYTVDWNNTIAYMAAPGAYGININLQGRQEYGIVRKNEYESIRDRLIHDLMVVINPQTGKKLFRKVVRREEVYKGDKVENAPDLILIPENYGIMVHHSIIPGHLFGLPEQKGMHRNEGIYFIYKEDEVPEQQIEEPGLADIAATILDLNAIAIPEYMEGRSICKLRSTAQDNQCTGKLNEFQADSVKDDIYKSDEIDEVKQRLKALGYL